MKLTGLKADSVSAWGRKLLRFFRKDFLVGLDIGASSIKLVQLSRGEMGTTLIKVEMKEIGRSEDPAVVARGRLRVLKEVLRGVNIKKSKFIVGINSPQMGVRILTTPPMPHSELREGILFESKNYFPLSTEECSLDFQVLGETLEKGTKKLHVAVAVAPRQFIDETLGLLKEAGVKPIALIPIPSALQKLGESSGSKEEKVRCFIDMGERHSELVILKGKDLIFSRKVPVGGLDFTTAMTGVLVSDRGRISLTLEEAEAMKRQVGIPQGDESWLIGDKISTVQIASMLRSSLEQLASEIDRCFDYYREETGGGKVDSLILFGRGAGLGGLPQLLSEELGIEVKLGNPLDYLQLEAQMIRPEEGFLPYAGALGAALSEGRGINLLPPEIKKETEETLKRATLQSAGVSTIFFLAFLYIGMQIQLSNFHKRIEVAKMELTSLQSDLHSVHEQIVGNNILAEEPYWEDVFKEISSLMPASAYLTELSLKDGKIILKGVLTATEREVGISDFISNLENGILKDVRLVTSRAASDKSGREFEIEGMVE